ncbi:tetratricopeptide repeat protein [Lewinella sp. LCG006]|uniref:tetratricopeptide repeat protein n=1 Tax=Lewinella sp. LCG006 TaxID=3231911 RepID=UPI0034602ADE
MRIITLVLALLGSTLLYSQISPIDLFTSNARTDQRNYGNGVTKLLIDGDNLIRQGRWEEAIQAYDIAVEQWPNWAPAYLKRAMAKQRMGRNTEAERDLQRAFLISPNSVMLFSLNNPASKMRLLATLPPETDQQETTKTVYDLKTSGKLMQASSLINQLEDNQDLPPADIALLRGNLQLLQEDHFEAIAYYDWALQRGTSAELLHNRGLARILTYNFPDGCADLERASHLGYQPSEQQHLDLCSF